MRRRADALFELCDATLARGAAPSSTVHLSLEAVHRRGWGSLYGAFRHGQIVAEALGDLLARLLLESVHPPVYAVDVSAWPRNDAEASPGRGYYYHPSRHSAGQPIVAGWAYQLIARLSFERDSWVTPLDARRVRPDEDANDVAAEQVAALAHRLRGSSAAPLFVFDAGYDPVRLQRRLAGCRTQVLVRLHSGRTFYAEPEVPAKRPVGRPFRHGRKFSCKDSDTWPRPTAEHHAQSADYGSVRVRAWSGLHPKTRRAGERYGATTAAVVEGTVILVEVGRLPRGERRRKPKALWLWWYGEGEPDLDLL
jgi:DDE superfamily endonuclease